MNHRELILSARKKAKFAFLSLPEDLQDEVIAGLDGQTLTLEAARDLVAERGFTLSDEAIRGYYQAVRSERCIHDTNQAVTRLVAEFADKPYQETLQTLINVLIATSLKEIAEGNVGIKDIDLGKVLAALPKASPTTQSVPADGAGETARAETGADAGEPGLSGELATWLRDKVLGVKKR